MTTKELSAKLGGLIRFSLFSDTKKLIKHVRASGAEIIKGSARNIFPTGYYPAKMMADPRFDEARHVAPKKRFISVMRGETPEAAAGMGPIESLWHEAGHTARRSSQVNPNLDKYTDIHQIAAERGANRAAMGLARQLNVSPESEDLIRKGLKKSFKTYKTGLFEQKHYSSESGKRWASHPPYAKLLKGEKNPFKTAMLLQERLTAKKLTVKAYPWLRGYKFQKVLDDLIQFKSADVTGSTWVDNPLYPSDIKSSVQHVPIKHIISHQETVKSKIVKSYKKKPGRDLPTLHKVGKKYFVEDGNHRIVAKKEKGEKTVRARVFEKELIAKLDDLIEFKLYQPKGSDEPPKDLPLFKEGQVLDYNVQRHHAKRAGLHRDVRIGTPSHGLLSWATRSKTPSHGETIAIHQQSTHPHSYLGWSGEIPSGYGAGQVASEELRKALVTKSSEGELHATLSGEKGSHRVAFVKTKHGWLFSKGKAPQPPKEAQKPPAKSLEPKEATGYLKDLPPGSSVQPKVDGALVFVDTKGGRPEIFSHRVSKTTGQHPIHTERVFRGRPTVDIPREHQRTLIGELYGKIRGKAIPPQDLGGILNAHIHESIRKQKEKGIKLKVMPFDYVDGKDEQYAERLEKVRQTVKHLPADVFHPPEEAKTPAAAQRLYEKIRSGRHPLTKEGVVIHPPEGTMVKVKHTKEANVQIHSTFPGTGKFEGSHGGFYYSDKAGKRLGKVGTGFTDESRRELHKYVGRVARVRHQEQFPSGKLRAPVFVAIDEGK